TANTLVYVRGRGIVLNEPSVAALNTNNGQIVAVAVEAKRMIGSNPGNIAAVRPLEAAPIAAIDATQPSVRYFIQNVHTRPRPAQPRVVVGGGRRVTGVAQRAAKRGGDREGARGVCRIAQRWAAPRGGGVPVSAPTGSVVVDLGGDTTGVAVTPHGGIVAS